MKKPYAIRVLEGTDKNSSPGPDIEEPAVRPAIFDAPDRAGERSVWDEYAPILERIGLLTKLDQAAFEMLCYHLAEWRKCVELSLQKDGKKSRQEITTVQVILEDGKEGEKKIVQQSPSAHTQAKYHEQEIKKLWKQFGLTPAYRTGLGGSNPEDDAVEDVLDA